MNKKNQSEASRNFRFFYFCRFAFPRVSLKGKSAARGGQRQRRPEKRAPTDNFCLFSLSLAESPTFFFFLSFFTCLFVHLCFFSGALSFFCSPSFSLLLRLFPSEFPRRGSSRAERFALLGNEGRNKGLIRRSLGGRLMMMSAAADNIVVVAVDDDNTIGNSNRRKKLDALSVSDAPSQDALRQDHVAR